MHKNVVMNEFLFNHLDFKEIAEYINDMYLILWTLSEMKLFVRENFS